MLVSAVRAFVVRTVVPSRWSNDPDRAARALKRFGDVEADSAWQYMQAIRECDDRALKRMLFENVLEEFRHADYFHNAAHAMATRRILGLQQRRTVLVDGAGDLPGFLAYAHVCEDAIHSQFDSYASACRQPGIVKVFRDISADEASHGSETYEHLTRLVGSTGRARWRTFKARCQRFYEGWMRGTAHLGNVTFFPLLGLIFFLFGPFLKRSANDVARYAPMAAADPAPARRTMDGAVINEAPATAARQSVSV